MAAARSPARTRRRSTAPPRTRRAMSRRTSSRPGSQSAARSRWRTRSAWRTRCPCSSRRSARRRSRSRGSRSSSTSTSTSARRRSSATSTCGDRSTRRLPRTATSAVTTVSSRGSARTRPTRFARLPGSSSRQVSTPETVLITGGAGFIGSHLADELLARGDRVRALDALVGQVHGDGAPPQYLNDEVELRVGDVRDADALRTALDGVDSVVHLAARVGVGQSMYEVAEYTSANSLGTAVLLQAIAERPVRKLVVASSMSIYGEGLYLDADGHAVEPPERTREQLAAHQWDYAGLTPTATPERK